MNWDWFGGQFGHDLTGGLSGLAELVFPPAPQVRPPNHILYIEDVGERMMVLDNFVHIARLAFTLLFAILGGLIARFLAARGAQFDAGSATIVRDAEEPSSPVHESSRAPS